MRKIVFSSALFSSLLWIAASAQQPGPAPAASAAGQSAAGTKAYDARCATCHGPAMTGASGPTILAYVRYHTDAELTDRLRGVHATMPLSADEL